MRAQTRAKDLPTETAKIMQRASQFKVLAGTYILNYLRQSSKHHNIENRSGHQDQEDNL